jgi:hypothetical protein
MAGVSDSVVFSSIIVREGAPRPPHGRDKAAAVLMLLKNKGPVASFP